jgi:dockerin type I repeat protein
LKPTILLIALLIAGTVTMNFGLEKVKAKITPAVASNPQNFTIIANIEGWNATVSGCTSGTPTCEPTITEFRGVTFTAQIKWGDCCTHDFAIYTGGFPAGSVSTLNPCSLSNTNGCLATSSNVFQTTTSLSFTPTIPKDDFSGLGTFEYYCQFHPTFMHGKFTLYKSPDLNADGVVNIVDVATVAFSFGATPTSSNWNAAADLDNNGVVNILDVAFDAFYFGSNI